jgi:putative transcriptional regulator
MKNNIFFKYNSNVEPTDGCILVSEPHLPDNNFERTVILLCKHDEEGSFGFVLNRKSNVSLEELMKDAEGIEVPVYIGGPVEQNTLHFVHKDGTLTDAELVNDSFYWGGDFDLLLRWLQDKIIDKDSVRFFMGYSGWGKGQLMDEIKENSWIVIEPKSNELIFTGGGSEDMWKNILEEMGGRYSMYSKYPEDPRLN